MSKNLIYKSYDNNNTLKKLFQNDFNRNNNISYNINNSNDMINSFKNKRYPIPDNYLRKGINLSSNTNKNENQFNLPIIKYNNNNKLNRYSSQDNGPKKIFNNQILEDRVQDSNENKNILDNEGKEKNINDINLCIVKENEIFDKEAKKN